MNNRIKNLESRIMNRQAKVLGMLCKKDSRFKIQDSRFTKIEQRSPSPIIALFLILYSLFLIPPTQLALAVENDLKLTLPPSIGANTGNYGTLIMTVIGLVFAFLAVMAFGGIIYSGVMMITAGGDAAKFASGRKNLIWSIIGIIVVTLSYFILRFVGTLTGELVK